MEWFGKHSEVDEGSPDSAAWRVSKALVWTLCNSAGAANMPVVADKVMQRLAPLPVPQSEPEIIAQVWDAIGDVLADRGR